MSTTGPLVTLIRHGETEWSRSGRHTGRTDVELTAAGEVQAKSLVGRLGDRHFALVLCSPMQRARRTAELAGLGPVEIDDDLREWDYGQMEGRTTAEIRHDLPDWSIWGGPWPGGEDPAQVAARADRVVARTRALAPGAEVALVAHGHILRVLAARWLGGSVDVGRWLALDTAAVCELGWEHDYPVLRQWNMTSD